MIIRGPSLSGGGVSFVGCADSAGGVGGAGGACDDSWGGVDGGVGMDSAAPEDWVGDGEGAGGSADGAGVDATGVEDGSLGAGRVGALDASGASVGAGVGAGAGVTVVNCVTITTGGGCRDVVGSTDDTGFAEASASGCCGTADAVGATGSWASDGKACGVEVGTLAGEDFRYLVLY